MGSPDPVLQYRPIANEIELISGGYYSFDDPEFGFDTDVTDEVLACIGNLCRFSGQTREFYSIGQHCCLGADAILAETGSRWLAKLFLLHDAHEQLVLDVTTPMKRKLGAPYKQIEADAERLVHLKYGIPIDNPPIIKQMDLRMFATERDQLMPAFQELAVCRGVKRVPIIIDPWDPRHSRMEWLIRLNALRDAQP